MDRTSRGRRKKTKWNETPTELRTRLRKLNRSMTKTAIFFQLTRWGHFQVFLVLHSQVLPIGEKEQRPGPEGPQQFALSPGAEQATEECSSPIEHESRPFYAACLR